MKWTYVIRQKMKVTLVLSILSAIILCINFIDKKHFSQIRDSFNSVYEDRLMVETYIYELSNYFHRKELIMDDLSGDHREINVLYNDSIANLLSLYSKTVLTSEEETYFGKLEDTYARITGLEQQLCSASSPEQNAAFQSALALQYGRIGALLDHLSQIQVTETGRIVKESNRKIAFSGMNAQLEMGILIFAGLLGYILIYNARTITPNFTQKSMWN